MKRILAILFTLNLLAFQAQPVAAADAYVNKWGTFKTLTFSGTGDDVVELPSSVKTGTITATHSGEANFVIWALDTSLVQSGLQVNRIGEYSGTTEFGFGFSSKKTRAFEVTADGDWTIVVKSLSSATALPTSGRGDSVFKYSGGIPIWKLTHSGEANFVVWEYCTNGATSLIVNKVGAYRGTVRGLGGTCVVAVHADGAWTIRK